MLSNATKFISVLVSMPTMMSPRHPSLPIPRITVSTEYITIKQCPTQRIYLLSKDYFGWQGQTGEYLCMPTGRVWVFPKREWSRPLIRLEQRQFPFGTGEQRSFFHFPTEWGKFSCHGMLVMCNPLRANPVGETLFTNFYVKLGHLICKQRHDSDFCTHQFPTLALNQG